MSTFFCSRVLLRRTICQLDSQNILNSTIAYDVFSTIDLGFGRSSIYTTTQIMAHTYIHSQPPFILHPDMSPNIIHIKLEHLTFHAQKDFDRTTIKLKSFQHQSHKKTNQPSLRTFSFFQHQCNRALI